MSIYKKSELADLEVTVSEDELHDKSKEFVQITFDIESHEAKRAAFMKEWKDEMGEIKTEFSRLRRILDTGKERQEVMAEVFIDTENKTKWHEYEEEKYEQRPLFDSELESLRENSLFDEGWELVEE